MSGPKSKSLIIVGAELSRFRVDSFLTVPMPNKQHQSTEGQ